MKWSKCENMKYIEIAAREYIKTEDIQKVSDRVYCDLAKTDCTKELVNNMITRFILFESKTIDDLIENLHGFVCICNCQI
jgi:uncharacterized protein YllA (UPF0747 family)